MDIQTSIHELHPRSAFRIARQRSAPYANVILRIERDGIVGWGEASPNPFYGVTAEDTCARLHLIAEELRKRSFRSVADIERAWADFWQWLRPNRAAQCALDLALWDWVARFHRMSVCELALGHSPRPVVSFATIGISTPEELDAKLTELRGYPRIKIKSGERPDLDLIERVKKELRAEIAVDANCAWRTSELAPLSVACSALDVAFIEQPFPPDRDGNLIRGSYARPIFADESCVVEDDMANLLNFDGINVKLVKCGGLTPALRMLKRARARQMGTMVGCMIETSILIAAGCVAAQAADYADLDGAWLTSDDPCVGWLWNRGTLTPPDGLGLGAAPKGR